MLESDREISNRTDFTRARGKIGRNDLIKTSEKIQLYENIAKGAELFLDWWIMANNRLPVLKYKWESIFKSL